jgi:hypothetical protein
MVRPVIAPFKRNGPSVYGSSSKLFQFEKQHWLDLSCQRLREVSNIEQMSVTERARMSDHRTV